MVKNNSRESSSPSLSDLGDELLVEILCRLGFSQYATQCKCICKRWCSLIDVNSSCDSYFLFRWRKINKELPIALLAKYYGHRDIDYYPYIYNCVPTVKSIDFLPWRISNNHACPVYVYSDYKDLVLCSPSNRDHSVYCICNPFTKQWIVLPPPPLLEFPNSLIKVALFTSDEGNGNGILKFKVVRVIHNHEGFRAIQLRNNDLLKVEIFSSDNSSCEWKIWNAPQSYPCLLKEHVSYNGMLVWLGATFDYTYDLTIFKFPTHNDRVNQHIVNYTHLTLPPCLKRDLKLGVHRGCLRIAHLDPIYPRDGHKLTIWELNDQSQEWELVHDLDFSEVKDFSMANNKFQFLDGSIMAFHPLDGDVLYLTIDILEKGSTTSSSDMSYLWSCNVREKIAQLIRAHLPLARRSCDVTSLQCPPWPSHIPLLSREREAILMDHDKYRILAYESGL